MIELTSLSTQYGAGDGVNAHANREAIYGKNRIDENPYRVNHQGPRRPVSKTWAQILREKELDKHGGGRGLISVTSKNILTGEVIVHDAMQRFAEYVGCHSSTPTNAIQGSGVCLGHILWLTSEGITEEEMEKRIQHYHDLAVRKKKLPNRGSHYCLDSTTGTKTKFRFASECATHIGVNVEALKTCVRQGPGVMLKRWVVWSDNFPCDDAEMAKRMAFISEQKPNK